MTTHAPIVGHCMECSTPTGVTDALRLINTMGGRAIQISLGDPSSWTVRPLTPTDVDTVNKIRSKYGFYIVIHGKYLYNFCRPTNISRQHKLLVSELEQAAKIKADVIIHQGKNLSELQQTAAEAHQTYADNIVTVLDASKHLNNKVILENSARQGTECGYTLDSLSDIYQRIPRSHRDRIGFCIDLCHIFVAGELDVRDSDKVKQWFDRFDNIIGLDKLVCIHFNDSNTDFNGANDNHGSIGQGYIGRYSISGFKYICKLAYKLNIPLILETSSAHIQSEITMLNSWSVSADP